MHVGKHQGHRIQERKEILSLQDLNLLGSGRHHSQHFPQSQYTYPRAIVNRTVWALCQQHC